MVGKKKLSVAASNRNRLEINSPITQFFIKSIQWQSFKDFELVIADGGSQNYEEIKKYLENYNGNIPMRVVQHKIGEQFHRSLLNNVGIRNANSDFVMTTDVDMIFHKDFMMELNYNLGHNNFVESRTLYLKDHIAKKIYSGEIDPHEDWDKCKIGRIKKRTTAGGCQCASIEQWDRLGGFNEEYIGWGSEDQDLYNRVILLGLNVKWMGESIEKIKLLHQPHNRNLRVDLDAQEINKKRLLKIKSYRVNDGNWGGIRGKNEK